MSSSEESAHEALALNEAQRSAVESRAKRILILAGAGTGKTRTLTLRVARLISDGVDPERILVATFTLRAAREIQSRIGRFLGPQGRPVLAGTFHALAYRILKKSAARFELPESFGVAGREEQMDLMREAVRVAAAHGTEPGPRRLPNARDLLAIKALRGDTRAPLADVIRVRFPDHVPMTAGIEETIQSYQRAKRAAGVLDFDDLLDRWREGLEAGGECAADAGASLAHVLVDEFQDVSPLQAEITELLAGGGAHLCVVGDDAQSIFGFRGARFDTILDFPRRRPTEVHALVQNYRSDPAILAVANQTILSNPLQLPKQLTADRPAVRKPVLIAAHDPTEEAAFVAQRVIEFSEAGVALRDQAVLYRAHTHGASLELELVRRGIPYVVRSGVRLLEQAHVRDALAFIRVLADRTDGAAWTRLAPMLNGVGPETLKKLVAYIRACREPVGTALSTLCASGALPARARRSVAELGRLLERLDALPRPADRLRLLLLEEQETFFMDYLGRHYPDEASRAHDLDQLAAVAGDYARSEDLLSELALVGDASAQASEATGPPGGKLVLSTVHQAKGLEWRAVFVIQLVEGSFPHRRAELEPDGLAEERRLFYVAVTRAQEHLYLTYPRTQQLSERERVTSRPSRFVTELGPGLVERWALR